MKGTDLKEFVCVKGNPSLGFAKGKTYKVLQVTLLGRECSHQVGVRIQLTNRVVTLYARHINRLLDYECNLNNGNPTQKIRVRPNYGTIKLHTPKGEKNANL